MSKIQQLRDYVAKLCHTSIERVRALSPKNDQPASQEVAEILTDQAETEWGTSDQGPKASIRALDYEEDRHFKRYGYDKATLMIGGVGFNAIFGHSAEVSLIDLSENGLSFLSEAPSKVGKLLTARLMVSDTLLGYAVVVVRNQSEGCDGKYQIGCEIDWEKTRRKGHPVNPKKLLRLMYMAHAMRPGTLL